MGENSCRSGRVLIDAEHFDLVRVQLRDEEQVALDEQLFRPAAADDLLPRLMIAKVEQLPGNRDDGLISLEVHIAVDELVRRCVKDVQLAAKIVKGGGLRRIGHHRRVAQRLAGVADGHAIDDLRQTVAGLGLIEHAVGGMTSHDAPAPSDLHVGGQPAHRHGLDEHIGVARNVDHGDGVPQRIGYVERRSIRADRQVAGIRAVQLRVASRDLRELCERRAGRARVDAERAYLILHAVGHVEARAVGIKHQVLAVKAGLELSDHGVVSGIDHASEVGVLIHDHGIGARIDRGVSRGNFDGDRTCATGLAGHAQADPAQHFSRPGINGGDAPIGVALASGQGDVKLFSIRRQRQRVRPAAKRLLHERPMLAATLDFRIVRVDARAGIRAPIEVVNTKLDFRKPVHAGAWPSRLGADKILDRVVARPGDDLTAGIGLHRSGEEAQTERRLRQRRRQHQALE